MATRGKLTTTATTFEIVFALQELDGATLTELHSHLDLSKSTLHRHLTTLIEYDFVTVVDGKYHIGLRFLELGEYTRSRTASRHLAKQSVGNLARETGERAQFVVEEHGMAVVLHIETGEHAVRTGLNVGHRMFLHSTAAGKVILADLPNDRVEEIIETHSLPKMAPRTITDRTELLEQLDEIRARGYAINREENIKGLCAVAVPVNTDDGHLTGVLCVSGPSNRIKGERLEQEIPDLLLGSANELELRIAYA